MREIIILCSTLLLLLVCFTHYSNQACTPLPLGKSQVKSCNYDGSVCTYDVTSSFLFNVAEADTVCLKLTDRDGDHVNITINKLAVDYTAEYCYFTDDPIPHYKVECGCPLSATSHVDEECSDIKDVDHLDKSFSSFHKMITKGCLIEKIGNVCAKHAFEAMKRFKVCKINKQWQYDAVAKATYKGMVGYGHNEANNMLYINLNGTQLQVIINLSQVLPTQISDFILIDLYRSKDFYLLPSSLVNDLNTYDINKIGWLKVKSIPKKTTCNSPRGSCELEVMLPPISTLHSIISPTMIDCLKDKVTMTYSTQSLVSHTLEDNPQYRASSISPSSVYIDDDVIGSPIVASKERFDHTIASPEHIVQYGYIGVDIFGAPIVVGLNNEGQVEGAVFEAAETREFWSSCSYKHSPPTKHSSASWSAFVIREKPTLPTQKSVDIFINRDTNAMDCLAIQKRIIFNDGLAHIINAFDPAEDKAWDSYVWPEMIVKTIRFRNERFVTITQAQTHALPTVVVKPNLGAITLLVKGTVDIITQINDNARVNLVACNSTHCNYENQGKAQSCNFESNPQVFIPTQIMFKGGEGVFELHPMNNFTGTSLLSVSCGQYTSSKAISYNFTLDIKSRKAIDNAPAANDVTHEFKSTLGSLWEKAKKLLDFSNASITTYIIWGLIICGVITVLVIGIIIFVLIFPYISPCLTWCCMCCCSGGSNSRSGGSSSSIAGAKIIKFE